MALQHGQGVRAVSSDIDPLPVLGDLANHGALHDVAVVNHEHIGIQACGGARKGKDIARRCVGSGGKCWGRRIG